jgi:hypothetical protein
MQCSPVQEQTVGINTQRALNDINPVDGEKGSHLKVAC